jgi:hypothetical protein
VFYDVSCLNYPYFGPPQPSADTQVGGGIKVVVDPWNNPIERPYYFMQKYEEDERDEA